MKAAIAVDNWKLAVFRKRLTEAGFEYKDAGAFTPNVTILTVITDDLSKLHELLKKCQNECKNKK